MLADFADKLLRDGVRVGGIVQRNHKDATGRQNGMEVIDLTSGRKISICQPLGSGAMACKLDAAGLAEAAVVVANAISQHVELMIINKFSKQEASGRGLRSEFAEAIMAGIPVLTAVPLKSCDAWREFTGNRGTTLLCAPYAAHDWWRNISVRIAASRKLMPARPAA
jgi:molybdate transport system ATP-binding protein